MEEAEQIVNDARRIIPHSKSNWFVSEFRELIRVPLVQDWHIRSLKIFEVILDYDTLTRRLFRFFQLGGGRINWNLSFLESAYLNFDTGTYRRFFVKMLEFAYLGRKKKPRQNVGNCILEILKERENLHRWQCQISGNAFPVRYYEKFRFIFGIYLMLNPSRFDLLLDMLNEHKSRGAPSNECEIERFRHIALEFFEGSEYLTHGLLDFCTSDEVKPYFVFLGEQNHPLPDIRIQNNPTPDSMYQVGQGIQDFRIPNPISVIPTRHNYPVQCATTQDNPNTVAIRENHSVRDHLTRYNQKLYSATTVGQDIRIMEQTAQVSGSGFIVPVGSYNNFFNFLTPDNPKPDSVNTVVPGQSYSVQGLQIPEHPDPVSLVPMRHNNPVQGVSTLYNPTTFLFGDHPILDLSTPYSTKTDSSTSVGHSAQNIKIQEHPTPVLAVPVKKHYPVQLPLNPLSDSENPIKTNRAIMEAPISVPTEPFETSGMIPEARTRYRSTQDLNYQPLFTADSHMQDGTAPSLGSAFTIGSSFSIRDIPGPLVTAESDMNNRTLPSNQLSCSAIPVETNRANTEAPISAPAKSLGTSAVIPEARTKHCRAQDLKMLFKEPVRHLNWLARNLVHEKKREADTDR